MNNYIPKAVLLVCILALIIVYGSSSQGLAQEDAKKVAITSMTGDVQVLKKDSAEWQPANPGDTITEGDSIKTLDGGKAKLQFPMRGTIDINEKTQLAINRLEAAEGGKTETSLLRGKIRTNIEGHLNEKSKFEVRTPTAVAGVVGTEFYLNVSEDGETISEASEGVDE